MNQFDSKFIYLISYMSFSLLMVYVWFFCINQNSFQYFEDPVPIIDSENLKEFAWQIRKH